MLLNYNSFIPMEQKFEKPEPSKTIVAETEVVTLKDGTQTTLTRSVIKVVNDEKIPLDGRGLSLHALVESGYPPTSVQGQNFLQPTPEQIAAQAEANLQDLYNYAQEHLEQQQQLQQHQQQQTEPQQIETQQTNNL